MTNPAILPIALLSIVLTSLLVPSAFAESLQLPDLPADGATGINVYPTFQSEFRSTIHIEVQYQHQGPTDVPLTITYFSLDGSQAIPIPLQDLFIKANNPVQMGDTLTPEEKQSQLDETLQRIEDRQAEVKAKQDAFYSQLHT